MLGSHLGEDIVAKMKVNEKRIYRNGCKAIKNEKKLK